MMKYAIYSETNDRMIATGEGSIVIFDYANNRKVERMDEALRAAIVEVEAEGPRFC
jgi:acyl-CoA thioesterase FadM